MEPVSIYALRDPDTDDVRYIGQSKDPRTRRLKHMHHPSSKLEPWISNLNARCRVPAIQILEETTKADADEREIFWIMYMLVRGCDLLNSTLLPTFHRVQSAPLPRRYFAAQSYSPTVVCLHCGRETERHSHNQKFCSYRCGYQHSRKKQENSYLLLRDGTSIFPSTKPTKSNEGIRGSR